MRFGSFVLTYERPEALRLTLERMLSQSRLPEVVLVVDNGSSDDAPAVVRSIGSDRLRYERTGENLGSAGGVAYGMTRLAAEGFDWIHSIDDDDPPRTPDTVERLQQLIERNDDGLLGAVAATGSRWNWSTGEYQRIPDEELHGDLVIDTIGGNSHLTVRREVIERIGPPERAFFFGFYDPLYCLRIAQAGYQLMADGDLMREYRAAVNHIGWNRERAWLPREPYHAIWRRYYVTRNYIFRMSRTFDRPDLARREARKALLRSAAAWGHGPRYGWRYGNLQLRGVLDGYRGRLGRTVDPVTKPSKINA